MKLLYKILFLTLVLLPVLVFAGPGKLQGKYTKEKTLKKEYNVKLDAALVVDNSFGNIDVSTWNENRISIVVTIKTNGNDEKEVENKLDEITVDFSGNESLVKAKTNINQSRKNWSWFGGKSSNVSMEINYIIKIPISNAVNLDNNYGTISITKLKGVAKIQCNYGQLIVGDLQADNNSISINYTTKSTINYMKSGTIKANYSGITLRNGEQIRLMGNYTDAEFLNIKSLDYQCDYGKITIDKSNKLSGQGIYLTTRIGTVVGSVNLTTLYGNIKIDELATTTQSVVISANYTQVVIGFDKSLDFNFTVNTSYSDFKGENAVHIIESSKDGSNKRFVGYNGSQSTANSVKINSNYGNIIFNKL